MKGKHSALLFAAIALGVILASGCLVQKDGPFQQYQPGAEPVGEEPPPADSNTGSQDNGTQETQPEPEQTTPSEPIGPLMDACLRETSNAKIDECLMSLAESRLDDQPCELLKLFPKSACYKTVGIGLQDDVYCGKIRDGGPKNECYFEIAVDSISSTICGKIENDQRLMDDCLSSIAIVMNSHETCDSIFDPTTRDNCYLSVASSTGQYYFCEKVSGRRTTQGYVRDVCYSGAGATLDGEVCANFIDEDLMKQCFENAVNEPISEVDCLSIEHEDSQQGCIYWYSTKAGDVSYCYNLKSQDRTLECLEEAITVEPEIKKCLLIHDSEFALRNKCYFEAAVSDGDENLCDTIKSDSVLKNRCISEIALAKEDPELCLEIIASKISDRDQCISNIAFSQRDYSKCELVKTDQIYYGCYAQIALSFGSAEICREAKREDLQRLPYPGREYCFKQYAVQTENAKICERISFSSLESQCKDEVDVALICRDNDGVCDENLCDYTKDNDCESPYTCNSDDECADYKASTKDTCNLSNKKCEYTTITDCLDNDNFCPNACTFTGDADAIIVDSDTNATNEDNDCIDPESVPTEITAIGPLEYNDASGNPVTSNGYIMFTIELVDNTDQHNVEVDVYINGVFKRSFNEVLEFTGSSCEGPADLSDTSFTACLDTSELAIHGNTVEIRVDPDNDYTEGNESNNTISQLIS